MKCDLVVDAWDGERLRCGGEYIPVCKIPFSKEEYSTLAQCNGCMKIKLI